MSEPARELLGCAAALLDQGRAVDRLSRMVTTAALGGLVFYPVVAMRPLWTPLGFTGLVALAGLVEMYFALRVAFDQALFNRIAGAREAPDFAVMDEALMRLGLMPASKAGRPVAARVAGASRLLQLQILAFAVQVLFAFAGACIAALG